MAPMNGHTLICHTDPVATELPEELLAAARAHTRAEEMLKRRREELALAIANAVRDGAKLSHVARAAGYTPEHVRRIARAHGVEGDPSRIPPPAPPRRAAAES